MTALHWLTLAEAARSLRRRELVGALEYTEALLARIEAVNPKLDAFIALLADRARERAAALDNGPVRGVLHGVPFGLKDIIDVAGVPTTAHSAVLKDNVAAKDAGVTRRLEGAAGVLLGKLSTHEFAIGGPSFDLPWPPARNPWNTDCHPGGSSSGSGAGVAAGLFPLALGTDTGGSVRNPASCCGIVGMKATYGRVSRAGVAPLSWSMDHIGPMTRTVGDNALALEVLAGYDPEDPASADEPVPSYTAGLERGVKGMKIGHVRRWHEDDMPAAPEMRAAIDAALRVLEGEGAEIVEVDPGPLQDYSRGEPHHPLGGGLVDPRALAEGEARSLWPPRPRTADRGRLSLRRGLSPRAPRAGPLHAAHVGGACRRGRARLRVEHGAGLRHRGRAGGAADLFPPGAPALQCHRPSGARRAGRLLFRRHAALVPDCRQELRRGHDLPRRPRL